MILLGFFGFLRCDEFTSRLGFFDPKIHPTISDIIFCSADTLIFNLKQSKTNQSGPAQRILIFKLDSDISPYEPIFRHVQSRLAAKAGPSDPLFVTDRNQIVSRSWFVNHFKELLKRSGLSPSLFTPHSLRIGAATTASRNGISDRVIKDLGRWSSHAYASYIRNRAKDIKAAHTRLVT